MSGNAAISSSGVRAINAISRMFLRESEMIAGALESNAVLLHSGVCRESHNQFIPIGDLPSCPAIREFWSRHAELRRACTVMTHVELSRVLDMEPCERPSAEEIAAKLGLSSTPTVEEALRFASEVAEEIRDATLDAEYHGLRDIREPDWFKPRPSATECLRFALTRRCSDTPGLALLIATVTLPPLAALLVWLAA